MNVVRDMLDTKVVDRNGREIGRADRVLLRLRANHSPLVEGIEIGPAALADRVHPLAGRWVVALLQALGFDPRPLRIEWSRLEIHEHIKADVAYSETGAARAEQRLRRLLRLIPRSS